MADYNTLQQAIDAGITNMTCNRNNNKNDDSIDTISSGIDWFRFNSVLVSNFYLSGNSFIGIGANAEQLKVNRRDCAVYYEYIETGSIVAACINFVKIRWSGNSTYNPSGDNDKQQYDVFFLSNGQIFLHYFDVPLINCSGENSLTCGSQTVSFSVTAGKACEYTFTPSDPVNGIGWSVASGYPDLPYNRKPNGSDVITLSGISGHIVSSSLLWTESKPEGATVLVSSSVDGINYSPVINGGEFIPHGGYDEDSIYIKIELSTSVTNHTPVVSELSYFLGTREDRNSIILEMQPQERFENAAGDIVVSYSGGTLMGQGGPVAPFEVSFSPEDLAYDGDQNDSEHINISNISLLATLTRVYLSNTPEQVAGHINISNILQQVSLTHVDNI